MEVFGRTLPQIQQSSRFVSFGFGPRTGVFLYNWALNRGLSLLLSPKKRPRIAPWACPDNLDPILFTPRNHPKSPKLGYRSLKTSQFYRPVHSHSEPNKKAMPKQQLQPIQMPHEIPNQPNLVGLQKPPQTGTTPLLILPTPSLQPSQNPTPNPPHRQVLADTTGPPAGRLVSGSQPEGRGKAYGN